MEIYPKLVLRLRICLPLTCHPNGAEFVITSQATNILSRRDRQKIHVMLNVHCSEGVFSILPAHRLIPQGGRPPETEETHILSFDTVDDDREATSTRPIRDGMFVANSKRNAPSCRDGMLRVASILGRDRFPVRMQKHILCRWRFIRSWCYVSEYAFR